MSTIRWWWRAILGREEEGAGIPVCIFFWALSLCSFTVGSGFALREDRCSVTRIVQLNPPYLLGCILWGKRLPEWKL